MFATVNYIAAIPLRRRLLLTLLALAGFNLTAPRPALAGPDSGDKARFAAHAQEIFAAAQKFYAANPTNTEAAWKFSRAGFDRAEYASNASERATIAVQCIAACRDTLARDPKSVPARYYLGMNLGQLAQTKMLGALRIVDEMEREFKTVRTLDEKYDYAGADRNLGLLYHEAPVIGSIGSKSKARKHLERAVELAPDFPENRLNLAEAYLKWGDKKPLQRELDALEKLWPAAQKQFAGPDWEAAWPDWQKRKTKLLEKAQDLFSR